MDEEENENTTTPAATPEPTPAAAPAPTPAPAPQAAPAPAPVATPAAAAPTVTPEEIAALREQLQTLTTERDAERTNARNASIQAAATRLNFHNPADAARFVASDATDVDAALAAAVAASPYLVKTEAAPVITPTSPTNPARTGASAPLTKEILKAMTPQEIAARWEEVKPLLKTMNG